jgi:predicted nucleotidyltransferase
MTEAVKGPSDLSARLETLGEHVGQVPGVVFGYLFGSAASDRMGPLSDVDVAVYLDYSVDPFETKLAILDRVSKHLETDRLDLVVLNDAPLALAGRVLANRRVIVDHDPFARHQYESMIIREFADFRLVERRHFRRRSRG